MLLKISSVRRRSVSRVRAVDAKVAMEDQRSPQWHMILVILMAGIAGAIVWWAASALAFVCDDAYIAFRYVSQWMAGHGFVWNAEPFRPVEGYTSPLWVFLLGGLWSIAGVEPPIASNAILPIASAGSLLVIAWMTYRLPLSDTMARWRLAWVALVLLGTATNMTFIHWTTSGLEQGLFSFFVLLWIALGTSKRVGLIHLTLMSTVATLIALTRPDGLLYVAATAGLIAWRTWPLIRQPEGARSPKLTALLPTILTALPLSGVLVHLTWRVVTYGEILPNTYYAKSVGAWPTMGIVYLTAFILEYAYFLWIPFLGIIGYRLYQRRRDLNLPPAHQLFTWATLGFHFAYYTLLVGGDHFEFRVYHHLTPLMMLALPFLMSRVGLNRRKALPLTLSIIFLSGLIPWTHHARLNDHLVAKELGWDPHDVTPHVALPFKPWAFAWDACQDYMRGHFVGLRRRAHVNFIKSQRARYPSREQASAIDFSAQPHPIHVAAGVGYPAWVLQDVAILDKLGLNDWVIARSPARATRKMAHDRVAPKGYLQCFAPNVKAKAGNITIVPRQEVLTSEAIIDCERRYAQAITAP